MAFDLPNEKRRINGVWYWVETGTGAVFARWDAGYLSDSERKAAQSVVDLRAAANRRRRSRANAYKSLGLTRVVVALGGVYWE